MNERETIQSAAPSLHEPEAYYRHLFDHAGVAMIAIAPDLSIRAWNAAAATMFGASGATMAGQPVESVIPAEGREEAARVIREAVDERKVSSFEFQHRDTSGAPRTLAVTVSPVISDDGIGCGALACFRDISRRVDLESEAGKRNKMASLYRMAGALAHHLNNILGGVVTSVDYALAIDDPNLQTRALVQTGDALARASKLIDSLLAFAEGDQKHHEQCDLHEVIRSVTEYVGQEMAAQKVDLRVELGDIPRTPVPLAQMVTVLENILHNALDAMPDGGTVVVKTECDGGGGVTLAVTDTGCGVDPPELQQVFDPFFSTKSREGMDFEHHPGLGLTVAHGILQNMGCTISIESRPGQSTTVHVHFTGSPPGKT